MANLDFTVAPDPEQSPFGLTTDLAYRMLLGDDELNSTQVNNGTTSNSFFADAKKWQITLIATLASAGLLIIVAMALIWKFCGKKHNDSDKLPRTVSSASSASRNDQSKFPRRLTAGCCGGGGNDEPGNVSGRQPTGSTVAVHPGGRGAPHDPYVLTPKPVLPPIGVVNGSPASKMDLMVDDASVDASAASLPPKRLAPLADRPLKATMATNLAGNTVVQTGVYGPIKNRLEMLGVPVIPVPVDQRRPLPPPPTAA